MKILFLSALVILTSTISYGQEITKAEFDSLKSVVFDVSNDIQEIDLNLKKAEKKLKLGILVSTIGYTVTIIGGQLLGGPNNDTGEVLLYTGGAIGITGTVLLFDGFKHFSLSNTSPKRN